MFGLGADTHYKTLGLSRRASIDEIKRAYRKLMMAHHPDMGGDYSISQAINIAYEEIAQRRGI